MENKIYYSKSSNAFFDDSINTNIPDDAIEITKKKHSILLSAINSGCIIFDDLSYSDPKPSDFYNWDGLKWIKDVEARMQYIKNINQSNINELIQEATKKIFIFQDAIDLDMAEDGDADKLKKWRKYRVLLSRVDTSVENMELPDKPD